jgi:hypothetical protein
MQDHELPFGNRHRILAILLLSFIVLAACLARLFSRPVVRTREEVAGTIMAFMDGTGGPYDWDDFICGGNIEDSELESIRARCASLPLEFPPLQEGSYCGDGGIEVMRGFISQLGHNENS